MGQFTSIPSSHPSGASVQLARALVDALNAHDWTALRLIASPDMEHHLLPRSLNRPTRTLDEWIATLERYVAIVPNVEMVLEGDMVAGVDSVCFHASSKGMSIANVPYLNEYMIVLHLSNDSSGRVLISRVEEMCDSSATNAFLEKMEKVRSSS